MINNKKGAEGPGLGTIIGLGVSLIAAVILILFFLGVFDVLGTGVELADDKVSFKVAACDNALSQSSFCNYDEVGKSGSLPLYINCQYQGANFQASLTEEDKFECDVVTFAEKCAELQAKKNFKGAVLNGEACTIPAIPASKEPIGAKRTVGGVVYEKTAEDKWTGGRTTWADSLMDDQTALMDDQTA